MKCANVGQLIGESCSASGCILRGSRTQGFHRVSDAFAVKTEYLAQVGAQKVGGAKHLEYWIPAEKLEEFNRNIVGKIEVIAEFST